MAACCFIGHRKVYDGEKIETRLWDIIGKLIVEEGVDTFLFGSVSEFNNMCYGIVTEYKTTFPDIKRIYVRAEYPYINEDYTAMLLTYYEETYYPERILGAGSAVYAERNYEMIKNSDFCVIYYDADHLPVNRKSGAGIALKYAGQQKKKIIRLP